MAAFPRVYGSFAEFERDELRKLDSLRTSIDDMLDEAFADELDFEADAAPAKRPGRGASAARKRAVADEAWD